MSAFFISAAVFGTDISTIPSPILYPPTRPDTTAVLFKFVGLILRALSSETVLALTAHYNLVILPLELTLYFTSLIATFASDESFINEFALTRAEIVDLASSFEESVVAAVAVGAQ